MPRLLSILFFPEPLASGWIWSLDVPVVLVIERGINFNVPGVDKPLMGILGLCVSESIGLYVSVTTGPMKVGKEGIGEWRSARDSTQV